MARSLGVVVTIALSLAANGCSFLFADPAPQHHEKKVYFDCTSTPGLEVADGVFALTTGAVGVMALTQSDAEFEEMNPDGDKNTVAGTYLVLAGVFAGSAIYGIIVTENCSDAKADLRQRILERERRQTSVPPGPAPAALPPAVAPPGAPPPAPLPTDTGAAPPPTPPPPDPAPPAAPAAPPAPAPTAPPAPKPGSGSF